MVNRGPEQPEHRMEKVEGYGRQVESPLHNRQKGQIDIMPRSNRAGRAISVIFTVYRERERENK